MCAILPAVGAAIQASNNSKKGEKAWRSILHEQEVSDIAEAREEVLREDPFSAILKNKKRETKSGSAFNDAWQV